jgi:hypothetical protein
MESKSSPTKKTTGTVIAIIAWFALILQLSLSLKTITATGFSSLKTITNFFSYFTILSNLFVAISLTLVLISPTSRPGTFFSKTSVQSAIAVYIFIVGLVYNLVLRNLWAPSGLQLVADNLLHVAVPFFYVIYWGVFTPRRKLQWKNIFPWLIFPALYLAYSLLRGPVANWYPYPFVDADKFGYGKVVVNSFFVLVAIVVVGLGLIAINRRGKTDRD